MGGKAKTGVVKNKWELKYIYEWYKVLDLLQKILGWVVDEISPHKWVIVEAGGGCRRAQDTAFYCTLEIFYNKNNWKRFLREKVYKLLEIFFHLVSL